MLVNVSRFKAVQAQVADLLQGEVRSLSNVLQLHGAEAARQEAVRLRRVFDEQYPDSGVSWSRVAEALPGSTSDIRVDLFNSDRDRKMAEDETVSWDRPARMIAVGGDVLSRGLTLEGLVVSYFHRAVTASDTLMQMARWFGYRDGYADLCRLWINPDAADNYRRASDSIDELRLDLSMMRQQQLTPADFGLAVRKHPDALLITARNKMRNAQSVNRVISIAGRRLETTRLLIGDQGRAIQQNRRLIEQFLQELGEQGEIDTDAKWPRYSRVDRTAIADLLGSWVSPPSDPHFSGSALTGWVRRSKAERFAEWDVVVAAGAPGNPTLTLGDTSRPIVRRELVSSSEGDDGKHQVLRVSGGRARLAGAPDVQAFVDADEVERLEKQFAETVSDKKRPPETYFYCALERPVLFIYPLTQPDDPASDDPFIPALKVAVPGSSADARDSGGDVEYVINTVAQQHWLAEMVDEDLDDIDA